MSETKHTPGPWEIGNPVFAAVSSAYHIVAPKLGFPAHAFGKNTEEAQANARLIAAAPDLLAALHLFQKWDGENVDCLADWAELKDAATAAIAKAEGSAQ